MTSRSSSNKLWIDSDAGVDDSQGTFPRYVYITSCYSGSSFVRET